MKLYFNQFYIHKYLHVIRPYTIINTNYTNKLIPHYWRTPLAAALPLNASPPPPPPPPLPWPWTTWLQQRQWRPQWTPVVVHHHTRYPSNTAAWPTASSWHRRHCSALRRHLHTRFSALGRRRHMTQSTKGGLRIIYTNKHIYSGGGGISGGRVGGRGLARGNHRWKLSAARVREEKYRKTDAQTMCCVLLCVCIVYSGIMAEL